MPDIVTTRRGRVLEIGLDRAPVNSITQAFSREIHAALKQLQDDPDLSVGLIHSLQSRAFSAGWDLKAAARGEEEISNDEVVAGAFGPGGFAGITEYWDLTKPVVAAIDGPAIGGGFEIAMACDVLVASERSYFWLPEMQRGILPDAGGIQRLPHLIPVNVAKAMILTGRKMTAQEAQGWGLVYEVAAEGQALERARAVADEIVLGAPLALMALKEAFAACEGQSVRDSVAVMRSSDPAVLPIYKRMMESEDALEGVRAFAEKRSPVWKCR